MTRNDYRHHSAWNDRNEAKMRWMTSEWWNETVAQTAKFSSHSTHFDVIRLILASSNSSVQWGWLINDPKMRSSSGPKWTTFPYREYGIYSSTCFGADINVILTNLWNEIEERWCCGIAMWISWLGGGWESISAFQEFQRDSSLSVGAQHIGLGHESPTWWSEEVMWTR